MRDIERLLYVVARLGFISIAVGLAISIAALIPFSSGASASIIVGPGKAYFIVSSLEPGTTISIKAGGEGLELYILKIPLELPIPSPEGETGSVEQLDELLAIPNVDVIANGRDVISLGLYSEERYSILVVLANRGDKTLFGYWDIKVERRLVPPHKAVWLVGGFVGAGACMTIPWAYVELKKRKRP